MVVLVTTTSRISNFICALSLFLFVSLGKGSSISFILSKNQLLVSLTFSIVFQTLFQLLSFWLYYCVPSTYLELSLFFSSSFRCLRLFIWDFSCFFRWLELLSIFLLKLLWLCPIDFGSLCFIFISLKVPFGFFFLILLLLYLLFNSTLFNPQVFVCVLVFFL